MTLRRHYRSGELDFPDTANGDTHWDETHHADPWDAYRTAEGSGGWDAVRSRLVDERRMAASLRGFVLLLAANAHGLQMGHRSIATMKHLNKLARLNTGVKRLRDRHCARARIPPRRGALGADTQQSNALPPGITAFSVWM